MTHSDDNYALTYCNNSGLIYANGVPFTIERINNVYDFFQNDDNQFVHEITIVDKINETSIVINKPVAAMLFIKSHQHEVASDKDFFNA